MRVALATVVMVVAGCDGAPKVMPDAGGAVDADIDAPVEAPSINGTWVDTYITANGSTSASKCAEPSALQIAPDTAAVTGYAGQCKQDGSFRINTPGNLGTYYLKFQGALYETTKHAGLDLSTDHMGRSDVGAVTGAELAFTMTGMDAWTAGDVLMAFSANLGYFQNVSFSSGAPTAGDTTLGGTAPWFGYRVDAAKSDALQIIQLGVHTTANALSYVSLDRVFDVPAFTMTNNAMHPVTGAFTAPPASTLAININVNSFHQFAAAANPNTSSKTIAGTAYAAPTPETKTTPALVSFARDSTGVSALDYGTLSYGDPFPAAWSRFVKISESFAVPYTWNNVTGSQVAEVSRVMTKAEAQAAIVDARLGPPTNPKLDGKNAFTAQNISPVPVVSWDAPTLGTPTDYEVIAYEVQVVGASLRFTQTLRLSTKQTSVRLPAGYLLGQRQYVFTIRARARDGSDMYTTPQRNGAATSIAETLTALVTTDS